MPAAFSCALASAPGGENYYAKADIWYEDAKKR